MNDTPTAGLGDPGPEPEYSGLREDMREDMRDDMYAQPHIPIRLHDDGRERLRKGNANVNPFDIEDIRRAYAPTDGDPRKGNIANEIDFNWKAYETYGKRDFAQMRMHHDQGWKPVMHSEMPNERFGPTGTEGPVIVKDMLLMWRPMRLTVQARQEEYISATQAMNVNRVKVASTPEGQAPRVVYADRSERQSIQIPD